jgi:acetolactate synthase-1/2/3 large subunit
MALLKGAEIIFDYLIKEKVPYMFGVPGHGVMGLVDVLPPRQDKIKVIIVHHEQAAGFMADAYFRIAQRPVATFASVGPGAANLPIALANALMDSSAYLAITGNVATNQFNRGTFQETHRYFQADFPSVVRPYVKRSFQVVRAEMLPRALQQAFTMMTRGRPGPVNLDVPFDVFQEEAEVELPDPGEWREGIDSRIAASPEAVRRTLDALLAAERPVILVGNGAVLSEAEEEVRALAEALDIPVANAPMGMSVMDADHPLALGSTGRDGT